MNDSHNRRPLLGLKYSVMEATQSCLQDDENQDSYTDELMGIVVVLGLTAELAQGAEVLNCHRGLNAPMSC